MFYVYKQNNSGGVFDHDRDQGIGYAVAIEADSELESNNKAEAIGIYFNGCDEDIDCPCCGDRWYPASDWDKCKEPLLYGEPLSGGWGISSYIHYKDGRVEERPCFE